MQDQLSEIEKTAKFCHNPPMASRKTETPSFADVGERLTQVRRVLGLSQAEIAERLGLEHTTRWNNWEIGHSLIPPRMVRQLKRMLPGLTTDWVYDEDSRTLTVDVAERLASFKGAKEEPVKRRGRPVSRH